MTLEEAIKHCEEVAEAQEGNCKYVGHDHYTKLEASACAVEHRQLAEWLRKLKERRTNTGDTISRQAAIDALYKMLHDCFWADDEELDAVITTLNELPSAQPEFAKDKNVPINNDISRQAVMALDMFTKIFCRDYAVRYDLAFRCSQCEFKMSNGKCLAKVMARKLCPDYKNFGCMGDL